LGMLGGLPWGALLQGADLRMLGTVASREEVLPRREGAQLPLLPAAASRRRHALPRRVPGSRGYVCGFAGACC
jgi:hypothetical protein